VQTDTEAIMAAIMDTLPPESRVAREVSVDELARTTPDGKVPAASKARPAAGTRPKPPAAPPTSPVVAPPAPILNTSIASAGLRSPKPAKKPKRTKPAKTAKPAKAAAEPTAMAPAKRTPPSRRVPGSLADR
jgi:hypothetical protein